MPRRNRNKPLRVQYAGEVRQAEKDRRRKRLHARASHPVRVNRNI